MFSRNNTDRIRYGPGSCLEISSAPMQLLPVALVAVAALAIVAEQGLAIDQLHDSTDVRELGGEPGAGGEGVIDDEGNGQVCGVPSPQRHVACVTFRQTPKLLFFL